MLDLNPAEQKTLVDLKVQTYRQEAEIERQIPKHSLRHHIAAQLRAWAERLEPSRPMPSHRVSRA